MRMSESNRPWPCYVRERRADQGHDGGAPRSFLEVNGESVFIPSASSQRRRVTVRVGDTIRLRATGNCAETVLADPQNSRLRVVEDPGYPETRSRYCRAVRSGVVWLVTSMPMCASPSNSPTQQCIGGIRWMGTALVTVIAAEG
jgi:hypothetical protein